MTSDSLSAVPPATHMPGLKISDNQHKIQHEKFLVTQAPGTQKAIQIHYPT